MYRVTSDEARRRAAMHARFELKRSRRDRVSLAYLSTLVMFITVAAMVMR